MLNPRHSDSVDLGVVYLDFRRLRAEAWHLSSSTYLMESALTVRCGAREWNGLMVRLRNVDFGHIFVVLSIYKIQTHTCANMSQIKLPHMTMLASKYQPAV